MKVFFCSCLQTSPALNLFVPDLIHSEFAAHCSGAHVLAHTRSLLLWVQCRGRLMSRGGREGRIWPFILATSPIYVREIQTCIWLVRDAPEPGIGVRNVCSSASQVYTLCDKSHQNVVWSLYSTHDLVFGVGIQAKPSPQFTWIIPMT